MGDIDVNIQNKALLDRLTAGLSNDIDKDAAVKSGLSRGGEIIKQGGLARLRISMKDPQGKTGNLERSMYVRVKKSKPGVLIGFTRGIRGGNHAHLVNDGTSMRWQKSKNRKKRYAGGSSGAAKGNYFWTRTKDQDMKMASNEVQLGIYRFVESLKSKL